MKRTFAIIALVTALGCSAPLQPNTAATPPAITPIAVPTPTVSEAAAIMGIWRHSLAKSKFKPGLISSVFTDQLHHAKVTVGDQGNYVEGDNGVAEALPAATATVLAQPPLADATKHRSLALAYFQTSGLTIDQTDMAQVFESTTMSGTGAPGAPQTLVRMMTHVPRLLDKVIRVDDSVAYVSFDAAGEVITETVYWPTISSSTVSTARQLATIHGDPTQHAAFSVKVAAALMAHGVDSTLAANAASHGQVLIHHTTFDSTDVGVTSFASYDVQVSGAVLHFLVDGTEVPTPKPAPQPVRTQ